jgi:DNA primase
MSLTPQWLDELRSRTLLSSLIGKTLKITKAGREFKGCCPFHNEKTPSFYVNDEKGFYHCFGCSAHGDAIRWMTDQRGLGFMDAVKALADSAGMEVPAADPRAAEKAERANSLYDVMAAAADWFVQQLRGIEGAGARAYLEKRGLKPETIQAFGMGYAPDARGKLKAALAAFGEDRLIEAGLLIQVEEKDSYDRFRGRLMIPIRDPRGRVIAFGGRILGAGEPKYLNSPDTPLFDKGRTLYNLDRAGPESRQTGRMIVVEGYMDVIALAQAGIADTVAPLGTALTEHQLERLWRMTDAPLLCFDGDSAGQKAAVRAIGRAMPALAPARSLGFITLPIGQDPDDVVKAGGRAAMDTLLGNPETLVDRLWRHEYASLPLETPEAKAGLKQRLNEHTQSIENQDVRYQYQNEFRARLDTAFTRRAAPRDAFQPFQKGAQRRGYKPAEAAPGGRARSISGGGIEPMFARAILCGLLRHPALLSSSGEALAGLPIADPALSRLRNVLLDAVFDTPALDSAGLIPICDSAGLAALVTELLNANTLAFSFTKAQADAALARRDLGMAIEALAARPELDAALSEATAALAMDWDETGFAEQTRLLEARRQADQKLAALAQGEDGTDV